MSKQAKKSVAAKPAAKSVKSKVKARALKIRDAIAVSLANAKRTRHAKFAKQSLKRVERLREQLKRTEARA